MSAAVDEQADAPEDPAVAKAIELATAARERSYSPYSDFAMGAGLVSADGTEVMGTLIENVSLGLAMCAERVSLFSAITAELEPKVLALCSPRTEDELTWPCGACVQVGLELAGADLIVVAVDPDGVWAQTTIGDLLPRGPKRFSPTDLPE